MGDLIAKYREIGTRPEPRRDSAASFRLARRLQ
jgi:hypothetical protein